jgi:hypothetical protein
MSVAEQIAELDRQRALAVERERVSRDAVFLHRPDFPLNENIAGYTAAPMTLFHCNLLRMMGSPFMPPFTTPGPDELAAFLWVVNPGFIPGNSWKAARARNKFLKTCRVFVKPAEPALGLTYRIKKWETQAAEALSIFTRTVMAAREYVKEAMQDKPMPASVNGIPGQDYYSDFCWMAAALMRHYHGLRYEQIQFLPLKVVYQFLKEIKEYNAAMNGEQAAMWNGSDEFMDRALGLLNQKN